MTITSNTGPFIALAKVNQLHLLEQLFSQVYVPPLVHRELLAKVGPETLILDDALARFIQVVPAPPLSPEVKLATLRLDLGEQQAIALAYHLKLPLALDDRLGRIAAQNLKLPVTGLVGILLQAKDRGLITLIQPLLIEIRQQGYWLSDELITVATKLAGEN